MHTIPENIYFRKKGTMSNRSKVSLKGCLNTAIELYSIYSFIIESIDSDIEFDYLKNEIDTLINIINKDTHIYPAEYLIRTIKE